MKNKKESNKKFTIRVDKVDHDLLQELVKEYGTMENALKKVIQYWRAAKWEN